MAEKKKPEEETEAPDAETANEQPEDTVEAEAAGNGAEAVAEEPQAEVSAAEVPAEDDPLLLLQAEVNELNDRLMRAVAETENVRRRADRERQDSARYAAGGLAKDLFDTIDNLGRALAAVPEEAAKTDESLNNLLVGVRMIQEGILQAFERHGIKRIDPKGDKFSYELHQAMQEVTNSGQPAGTVVEVLAAGYVMHDRLLRPAMVIVAKGDPDQPPDDVEHVDTTA